MDINNADFWKMLDKLIADSKIVIDRPVGTAHPRYPQMIYKVDYGYLEDTTSMDGGGIDLFAGASGDKTLMGLIVIIDTLKRDSEIKLLLGVSEAELDWIMKTMNETYLMKGILIRREG